MVRVCTADRLSCAKVVYLVYTAKRLGLDAPFCACFEKNVFLQYLVSPFCQVAMLHKVVFQG